MTPSIRILAARALLPRLALLRPRHLCRCLTTDTLAAPVSVSSAAAIDNTPSPLQINNSHAHEPHTPDLDPEYEDREPGPDDDVWVAMSSGVDSSTAAALLAQRYASFPASSSSSPGRVRGVFMANWSSTARCAEADWTDVRRVCAQLGIPCERVSFEREYWQDVFEPMVDMYRRGLTPNPDVGCNRHVKFGALINHLARKYKGKDSGKKWWLATGHYARVARHRASGEVHLLRPRHLPKDQSYYLAAVSARTVFPRVLFPLARHTKPQVRSLARAAFHLPTADKPDSQGLCFVSQEHNTFRHFLDEYLPPAPGNFVVRRLRADGSVETRIVGTHQGIWHATIGQKSGLSLPQGDPATRGVWYVQGKDPAANEIVLVRGNAHPSLFARRLRVASFEWLGGLPPPALQELLSGTSAAPQLHVQYRSLQAPEPVQSIAFARNEEDTAAETYAVDVEFTTPRRAVAPGQYLVVYSGDRVLGSGIITSTTPIAEPYS